MVDTDVRVYSRRAPGLLESVLSVNVCMRVCVCPPPRLLITSGVIYTRYDRSNKFYAFYMAAVVDIDSGRVIIIIGI